MDMQSYLRRANIFGLGSGVSTEDDNPDAVPNSTGNQTNSIASSVPGTYKDIIGTDQPPMQKAYKDFLSAGAPNKEDFKPSKTNRLAAILGGVSDGITHGAGAGIKTARGVLDEPYDDAMGKYALQAKKLEAGAGLEEKDINNRVKILRDNQTAANNKTKAEQAAKNETDKVTAQERKDAIAAGRAKTYEFLAHNPKAQIVLPKGGNVTAIDPITHKSTVVTDDQGNPIKTGTLSDTDLTNLRTAGRIKEIDETGDQNRQTEADKASNRTDLADKNNKAKTERDTANAKVKADLITKAAEAKKALQADSTLEEIRDKDNNLIGTRKKTITHSGNGVPMITPDGREITVPTDKVDEAIKRGAKKK